MLMDHAKNTRQELEEEFEELFSRIFRYLRLRIPSSEDAEDLAAEIFTKAWKRAHSYDSQQGTVLMWLFGIARHEIATYWKDHSIKQIDYDAVESMLQDEGRNTLRQNDELDLDRVLRSLTEEQRVLVIRHHLDGTPHAEIARSVGRTESGVRKIVSRAIRTLKSSVISK